MGSRRLFKVFGFNLLLSSAGLFAEPFSVTSFTPQGEVSDMRQVQARFSEDMVPAGDPGRPAPFVWDCPLKGQSVWVDARSWTLNLVDPAPIQTKCTFKFAEGLTSLAGSKSNGQAQFSFMAGGFGKTAIQQ